MGSLLASGLDLNFYLHDLHSGPVVVGQDGAVFDPTRQEPGTSRRSF